MFKQNYRYHRESVSIPHTHTHTHIRVSYFKLQLSWGMLSVPICRLLRFLPLTNFAPTWRAAKKRGKRINNFAIAAKARRRRRKASRERQKDRDGGRNCISYFCKLQHMPHEDSAQEAKGSRSSKQKKKKTNRQQQQHHYYHHLGYSLALSPVCHCDSNNVNNTKGQRKKRIKRKFTSIKIKSNKTAREKRRAKQSKANAANWRP